ncbi:hypothetical protein NDU88_005409 [Pleurodeles waltl]|uniref:Uncharacterized protein n=1 Tax=Pleurodeles waltl TaxID=8319 RepID=A0AAV7TB72_PLEWA|nr:hypothetical protein NDU88_005409 [Pleurodeles waltl]
MPLLPPTLWPSERVAGPSNVAATGLDAAWRREPTPPTSLQGSAPTVGAAICSVAAKMGDPNPGDRAGGECFEIYFLLGRRCRCAAGPDITLRPARHGGSPPPAAPTLRCCPFPAELQLPSQKGTASPAFS